MKWQRKLGPPKASESFYELYDRARALEEQEKQYAASSVIHQSDNSRRSDYSKMSTGSQPPAGTLPPSTPTTQATGRSEEIGSRQLARRCHHCKETGHLRRDCPRRQEALGRSSTNTVTAQQNPARVEDLTEQELERLLAERRLQRERGSVTNPEVSHANTITATAAHAKAVGSTLEMDVSIEGVSVRCLIDTGAQSTIISRATLRKVAQLLKLQGRPPPSLELPRVKLLGKGKGDYRELTITAQVDLTYMLDGRSAIIPTFIQPDSEQDCLLGANALPLLGITVSRSNGDVIMADSQETTQSDSQETQSDSQVTQSDSQVTQSDSRVTRSDSRETRSDSRETRSDSRETRSDSRVTRSDSRETRSDSRETRSDSRETRSDSRETRSDSRETRSDSRETRSDSRETRSDSRETRSDSRETRSDSRETRSDSRETRSDSRETRSDSRETRSDSRETRSDSRETRSDSRETRSDSRETRSDSRETRSDSRETRSDSRETRSDSRETRSDSRETRSDSRETRSDSRETRSDSRETRSDSRETRSDSRETRSDSRETRSDSRETRSDSRETQSNSQEPQSNSQVPTVEVAKIRLVHSITLPSQKGRVLEAELEIPRTTESDLFFEPAKELRSLGVVAMQSLLIPEDAGTTFCADSQPAGSNHATGGRI